MVNGARLRGNWNEPEISLISVTVIDEQHSIVIVARQPTNF